MKDRILQALEHLESEHGVRVLLAVESGSRAWQIASRDSDYDVRFIYAQPLPWYLSVNESRDVIEAMLPDSLDLVGWELRKTLRLLMKRNIELSEWLGSPIPYLESGDLRQQLLAHAQRLFNPAGALHHYSSMAAAALAGLESGGEIHIKKLFYVLRPLLACRFIVQQRTQPPTSFLELLGCAFVTPQERTWITQLLTLKAGAQEATPLMLAPARAADLHQEVQQQRDAVRTLAPSAAAPQDRDKALDQLLRRWVLAP
jgi:uncharacterized protein